MKHWLETRELLDRLSAVRRAGMRAALCTVVRVRGSAYRREGAKLLVAEDGSTTGNVSGGCLEQDVREVALEVLRSGRAEVRRYCSSSDAIAAWDLGVGCDGQVDVLIALAPEPRPSERALLDGRMPFAVVTALPTSRRMVVTADATEGTLGSDRLDLAAAGRARELLTTGRSAVHDLAGCAVFIEHLIPPPRLVICGAGEDARPLARLAAEVGFRVVVTDQRPAYLTAERFPTAVALVDSGADDCERRLALDAACYAVVMSHSFAHDQECIRALVRSPVAYIGVLGPRQRTERILVNLDAEGELDEAQRHRIYGPVGLDIGTDGAEQVALSIIAELLAVRSGRRARSARERPVPIHANDV